MLHSILSLRWVTLVAALGAALGAMLMFFEGCLKLAYALEMVVQPSAAERSVIATVMQATDAFLFGLVLIVFAYAITFGFAFNLPESVRAKAPLWMHIEGLGEIKITLIQVVLVYLVVDFVTDVVEAGTRITWEMLVKPTAIVLIAGALRLLGTMHLNDQPDVSEQPRRTSETAQHLVEK
ncbi:YqhA family protein [Microvirga aerophila]|uniref:Membrane protein n=1 Tax=Microvirga aerophila TaxID=670291 RepID=A0A512C0E3_9HYPH|nr:YqhA family protein [Microvirga aerophila]GEO17673.1 membrane protein [Microvirga aerophila]